jgi:TonB family protein
MKSSIWLLSLALASTAGQVDAQALKAQSESLPAPVQVSPANQARLHGSPRTVTFEWSKVSGANAYGIEIDYYTGHWSSQEGKPTLIKRVKNPTLTFDFYGDGPGSWRVWAIDNKERPGQVSAWSLFTFGPDNQAIPQPPPDTAPRFSRTSQQVTSPEKLHDPPVFDPKTGEACAWPLLTGRPAGVSPPQGIYTPEPEYAEAARRDNVDGGVMLAVDLGEDGLVKRVCILSASRDDLGRQALDTVRTWRFKPAERDSAPIPYSMKVEVTFHLLRR